MSWPAVMLAEVLRPTTTLVSIREDVHYQQVSIQPYPPGIRLQARKSGLEFSKKQQKLVRAGQFVISKLHTERGLWGLVPPELDGGVLSLHHLTFDLAPGLDRDYFAAYLAAPSFKRAVIAACSPHNRLLRHEFEQIRLPLLSADMQALVAEVWRSASAALTHTADMFAAIAEVKAGVARDRFNAVNPAWELRTLGHWAQIGRGLSGEHQLTVVAPDRVVRGAQISGERDEAVGIVPEAELDSQYLYYYLESQQVALRGLLSSAAPHFETVLQTLPFALPTLYEQRRIVAVLQQHDEALLRIHAEQVALHKFTQGIMQSIFSGTLNLQQIAPLLHYFVISAAG